MTTLQAKNDAAVNAAFPSLGDDALGALKLAWRWVHVEDDWSIDGEIGSNWDRFHRDFRWVEYLVVVAVVGVVAWLILRWRSSTIARRAGTSR